MRKKRLAGLLSAGILALLLTGCKETGVSSEDLSENEEVAVDAEEAEAAEETEAVLEMAGAEAETEAPEQDPIVGTWKTKTVMSDSKLEEWLQTYVTCFSPDGQVVHYGHRNVDRGNWERIDENTVVANFDRCVYKGIGEAEYLLSEYSVTYRFDEDGDSLSRSMQYERQKYFTGRVEKEGETVYYQASDFDDYEEILLRESDECEIKEDYYTMSVFPSEGEFCIKLEKRLIEVAKDLADGQEVELEQIDLPYKLEQMALYDLTGDGKEEIVAYVSMLPHYSANYSGATYILTPTESGIYTVLAKNTANIYSELLAPDGTVLISESIYRGSSSWKGGVRIHLGYRAGQVTVEQEEYYDFHWDYPLVNRVNDFQNGRYSVYVARNPEEGKAEQYGWYIDIEESLKIDEEFFQSKLVPFTGYHSDSEYPALYSEWSPFPESWWQDGGRYAEDLEDGDSYGYNYADWVDKAADDLPDEMLRKAVENSGLIMERKAYPWTAETKKNVTEILRCPVADYYYESNDYAAEYVRGDIVFYEKVFDTKGEERKRVVWSGMAEEAPPAVCYLDVLEEYERLWKGEKPEEKAEEAASEEEEESGNDDGEQHRTGKYAGAYFENAICESQDKDMWQLCYSLVDMSGEGICELLIGLRDAGNSDDDGFLLTVFTCQSGEITNIQHWPSEDEAYTGRQYWGLCQGNVLEISRAVVGYGDYWFYRLAPYAAWAEMEETFGYVTNMINKEIQCDYYDSEGEAISEEEYEALLRRYARIKIEWKELDGFF